MNRATSGWVTGAAALLFTALACPRVPAQPKGDLSDLAPVTGWQQLAHGVYTATIGNVDAEVRYSDLAGAPPRVDALNRLPDVPLNRALHGARYRIAEDGTIAVRIPTGPDEKIYGFGLQFDRTMHSGRILELKVDHFRKGGGATHAPVPFYLSSAGYGVFFNCARYIKIYSRVGNRKDATDNPPEVDRNPPPDEEQPGPWLAQPPGDAVEASLHGRGLDLVGFTGTSLQDIVARYNLYSGGGAMPPLWGLGFWHRTPSRYTAAEVEQEIAAFNAHDIPLDVIGLEPGWQSKSYPCTFEWQTKRFPDPEGFVRRLLDEGIRLNLWVNPYVSRHARIHDSLYPLSGSHLVWLGIVPDYTLPEARRILLAQHRADHFDIGISGYKIDEVDGYDQWLWPDHATFPSGASAETMRQTYGMLMQRMLYQGLFKAGNRRTYSLVRASNGAASRYPFVLYSDSYGHDEYITGLSSASLAGILWCPEVRSAANAREWINRMHTVCFSPMAQLNAWASGTTPWSYPEATDAVRRTIQLRMQLLPYLYTAFARYASEGIPPIRSMILETSEARATPRKQRRPVDGETDPYGDGFHHQTTEDNTLYMFGPDILIAPFSGSSTQRVVNLPAGSWYDFHTGRPAGSGETVRITAAQTGDLPPLFVREGALIPMLAHPVNRARDAAGAALEIRHYGRSDGSCRLYEDDGESFDFEDGAFRLRELSTQDGDLTERFLHDSAPPLYGPATLRKMSQ